MDVAPEGETPDVDVVAVGAGFAGLYLLHRLRCLGMSTTVLESADDVGGTWYWNRYPGARCDIATIDYAFTFDPELEQAWTWSEKYATQPEILRYLQFVADRYDLRRDIEFSTTVAAAAWDDAAGTWRIGTTDGRTITARYYVMATGCLSVPKAVDVPGAESFVGDVYFTSSWPHDGVDFTGRRVAVIGTGSSGIQSIPLIAEQAASLTVFQRTPNFSVPAHNGPISPERLAPLAADRDAYRAAARRSMGGVPREPTIPMSWQLTAAEQRSRFEQAWDEGELFSILGVLGDQSTSLEANSIVAEFIRERIAAVVDDPDTAAVLTPQGYPFGTKRPCLDSGYFATFNRPNVRLVDLHTTPITTITPAGIDTDAESFEFDAIVYATGFDAMTGALVGVDLAGRDGVTLRDQWAQGPQTYLGLMSVGFPNLFMVTGPGSPSVLSNMAVSIEQHVDWIADRLAELRAANFTRIEPTQTAQDGWALHMNDCASLSLLEMADSWYLGANVPGKPRVLLPYLGGVGRYRGICDRVAAEGMVGFELRGPDASQRNDGVIEQLQPDVATLLNMLDAAGLPPFETLDADGARTVMNLINAERFPGPDVGDIVDGTYPGPAGELPYRLFRPATPGPHPITLYFHGGGWVLGDARSDEPLCRDLCVQSDTVVVSVDYRHAPENRFPCAADDAFAAAAWVADHAAQLGGIPGRLAVAGWSAGGNLAAVTAQRARDVGAPAIAGQLLLCPVTDCDLDTSSYRANADGFVLTKALMEWFWNYYCDTADRSGPLASPLRASDLAGLPPACVVTCQFDPLRDEGDAYAAALGAAGVVVEHIEARGHVHTSVPMVGMMISAGPILARMAAALRRFTNPTR